MRTILFYCLFGMLGMSAIKNVAAQKTIYPNTLLWRISGKGLTQPSYLYGTMHLQDRRLFQFSDSLYYFLENTDGYAMEIDPDELFATFLNSLSQPDTSGLLKDAMNEKDFRKIASNLETQFGVPADKITKRQAWLYKQGWKNRTSAKPDDMDAAMDLYLYNIARRQGKWVGGIEDVEDQLGLIMKFDEGFDEDLLARTKKDNGSLEKLIKIYAAQDLNLLNDWCLNMDSVFRDELLTIRNKKMAKRIDSLAHVRSSFFAVGAAHLPGTPGLIYLLKQAGYQVEPVTSKKKLAPEAYHYKELEQPWYTVTNEEQSYQASMPGKAISFLPYSDIIKMKVYADMGAGIYYFITNIQVPSGKNKDSVLVQMAQNYARSSKTGKQTKIVFEDKEGIETTFSTSGYSYRMRLLSDSSQLVIMMTGSSKKDLLYHKEAEKFFASLKTNPASLAKTSTEWFLYRDENKAFEANFPSKPSFNKVYQQSMAPQTSDEWEYTNQVYVDLISQAWYIAVVKEVKPGYYIPKVDDVLIEPKKRMEANSAFSIIKYETGEYEGYPCMWLDGKFNENGIRMKVFSVVRGNRNYALMTVADQNVDSSIINKFISSFRFHDIKVQNWGRYSDSAQTFTTLAPAPGISMNNDQSAGSIHTSVFYDKQSGSSFFVRGEALPSYYWAINDSMLYANKLAGFVSSSDSVLHTEKVKNGASDGMEYLIKEGKDGRLFKKLRVLINGDSVYALLFIAPQQFLSVKEYDRFFNEFQFNNYQSSQQLFINKTQKILENIIATDSATREEAKNYIEDAPFSKADLPLLHKALLQPYGDFEESWNSTHSKLMDRVVDFADESTIDFIQQNYASLTGENEVLKYSFLKGLAGIATARSYAVLKDLLKKQLPLKGNPSGLSYKLTNNNELTRSLYPGILDLVSDSLFSGELVTVTNNLLDSNLLRLEDVKPYEAGFLQQANRLYNTIINSDGDNGWELYDWISLLGKFNDAKSNGLLQQFATSSLPEIQYNAALALMKNNQQLAPAILEKIAAGKSYRLSLYEECKKLGKLKLFPVKHLNQRSLAESELYSYASDEDEPSGMDFIGERIAVFSGKKQKFYLFKIQYTYSDSSSETYLGVAGPYPVTPGTIITEAAATGLYYDASFDPKQVGTQFKEYLEQQEKHEASKGEAGN